MCGIVGYIGNGEKKKILLDGLKELEYRGYDSAGIAILSQKKLSIFKAMGKLENLSIESRGFESRGFGLGIGHTRWATHGKPLLVNAHPHVGEFSAIVHNGIIENYHFLKSELESSGYEFKSQTDSEVIVHLFEKNFKLLNDAKAAFKKTIHSIQGSYAILLITNIDDEKIFYAKHSSPLLIASNGDEIYFSSSLSPLSGLSKVVYLNDGDIGFIDINNFKELKNIQDIDIKQTSVQKDGYRYFMEKEIYEQPLVLQDTLLGRIGDDINLELPFESIENINSITMCACGTSLHAALSAKYIFEREAKIKANVVIASEFRYSNPIIRDDELFIVISQSGETADTLEALKLVNSNKNISTLAICNVDNSSLTREAKYKLLTKAGVEKGVASTKAFATQILVLWMLSIYIAKHKKTIPQSKINENIKSMQDSVNATKVTLNLHEKIKKMSKRYLHGHGFFFIGRDIFYPLALEGALKLKEISYLHAEGYAAGEMKHGPIALVDSQLYTVSLISKHLLFEKVKSNTEELSARDATICVISQEVIEVADDLILIDRFNSYMEEFFSMMVVLQLFALEVAIRLNNDVDMPRNLAKSVTVE